MEKPQTMWEKPEKGEVSMRRHRFWAALALAACLAAIPALAAGFQDVDATAEYADAVDFISRMGIMIGDEKGNFNPNKTVTRAEMATLICRMRDQAEGLTTAERFPDVPVAHWANPYVSKAVELQVVTGYDTGLFGPADQVTYEQAVTMLVRAAGLGEEAALAGGYPNGFLAVAERYGMLEGIQSQVGEALSRADIAMILYNGSELLLVIT